MGHRHNLKDFINNPHFRLISKETYEILLIAKCGKRRRLCFASLYERFRAAFY
jgi:hypothetical protein